MGFKANAAIGGGVLIGAAVLLALFQKQIRNLAYTAGQTLGQAVTAPAEGFVEPFAELSNRIKTLFGSTSLPGTGTPTATPPIAVSTPGAYVPGSQPPAGSTPPDQGKQNGGYTFPGYTGPPADGGIFGTFPPPTVTTTTTTTTTMQPPTTPAPPPPPPKTAQPDYNKRKVGTIVINSETTSNYTKFLAQVTKAIGNVSSEAVSAVNQAWAKLQSGQQLIIIPGLPVISSPVIPAFAEKPPVSTKTNVSSNDKKVLNMGATSTKAVATQPAIVNWATFWDVKQIKVPTSGQISPTTKAALAKVPSLSSIQAALRGEMA